MWDGITTKCPKLGALQWSCNKAECVCHLQDTIPPITKETTMNAFELDTWVENARTGDQLVYHKGYLPIDKYFWYNYGGKDFVSDNVELKHVAHRAYRLYEEDRVHLLQRKLSSSCYEYIAVKA